MPQYIWKYLSCWGGIQLATFTFSSFSFSLSVLSQLLYISRVVLNIAGYTKLIVIGGYNAELDRVLSIVEVIDMENPTNTCNQITDYPVRAAGMTVGIIDVQLKSCGDDVFGDDCYDYNPATNSWNTSVSLINGRNRPRSSFIDGIWLVSGGDDYDTQLTTEMWTGTGFEPGPSVPTPLHYHCQLTINSTHVFFADTYYTGNAYLLNWYEQTWTVLPPMTVDIHGLMSCGLINNPENGIEVVIVEDGVTEIFNFRKEEWRIISPSIESFGYAGYAQIGDTFVVVGGQNDAHYTIDTIYKFDQINYEWILMSQRLQVPRTHYPGVVAVPDEFVTCS